MNLKKTKQRVLQWSMLSVLIVMLSPAAYAACLDDDFSRKKSITYSSKNYPRNSKGAVFLFYRNNRSNLSRNLLSVKRPGNPTTDLYVLPHIPTPLTADQFKIVDKTENKRLTPKLVRLSALDTYPINDHDHGYAFNPHYYIKPNRMTGCDKGQDLARISYKEFTRLLINKQLVDVTNEVKKAWGYFRVEPEEGLQAGHTYEFSYTAEKPSYPTVMKIGEESVDLEAGVSNIQPVEYEGYSLGRRGFAYSTLRYTIRIAHKPYNRQMKYHLPPSLRQYDSQLKIVPLVKEIEQGSFYPMPLVTPDISCFGICPDFMIKNFNGGPDTRPLIYPEFYPVDHFPYCEHKAKVGILEVDDQLYDTQTNTFFTGESGLYD